MGIDIAAVMDALRMLAIERKVAVADDARQAVQPQFPGQRPPARPGVRGGHDGRLQAPHGRPVFRRRQSAADVGQGKAVAAAQAQRRRRNEVREVFRRAKTEDQTGERSEIRLLSRLQSGIHCLGFRPVHRGRSADALGIELEDIPGLGLLRIDAGPRHQCRRWRVALPVFNLQQAQAMGLPVMTACASCYARLRTANYTGPQRPGRTRARPSGSPASPTTAAWPVHHVLDVLVNHLGLEAIRAKVTQAAGRAARGLLLRLPADAAAGDRGLRRRRAPHGMDDLVAALGGEPVAWPYKTECCGASLSMTNGDVVVPARPPLVAMARQAGASASWWPARCAR